MSWTSVPTQPWDRVSARSCADAGQPNPTDKSIPMMLCVQNGSWERNCFAPAQTSQTFQFIFLRFRWLPDDFCTGKGRERVPSLWFWSFSSPSSPFALEIFKRMALAMSIILENRETLSQWGTKVFCTMTLHKISTAFCLRGEARRDKQAGCVLCISRIPWRQKPEGIQRLQGTAFLRRLECYEAVHHHLGQQSKPMLPYSMASWPEKKIMLLSTSLWREQALFVSSCCFPVYSSPMCGMMNGT